MGNNANLFLTLAILLFAIPYGGALETGTHSNDDDYIPVFSVEHGPLGDQISAFDDHELISVQLCSDCQCCSASDPSKCQTTKCCHKIICEPPGGRFCSLKPVACNCNNCI
ncbi:unnamed protein product [Musa textilis]